MRYSDYEQSKMDAESGLELDRRAASAAQPHPMIGAILRAHGAPQPMNISKEWCENMGRREEGDPTTGDPLSFKVRRSVRGTDGKVQIVGVFPSGNSTLLLEVIDGEFDSDAIADRIVALWNAQP